MELWPSGRRHTPAKGADGEPSRGFESLRLRHTPLYCLISMVYDRSDWCLYPVCTQIRPKLRPAQNCTVNLVQKPRESDQTKNVLVGHSVALACVNNSFLHIPLITNYNWTHTHFKVAVLVDLWYNLLTK